MTIPLLIVFIACLVIGLPIALCMVLSAVIPISFFSSIPLVTVGQQLFSSLDSFTLLAIPFFVLAGALMDKGGVSQRLIDFANSLVGWLPGGLAIVTFFASAFFGAISGSSSATVAAIGGIMIPAMIRAGYSMPFAGATAVAAGFLGVVIPPSIPMILYGISVGGVSIGDLFVGGIIPGFLLAGGMSVYAFFYGKKNVPGRQRFVLKNVFITLYKAGWALGMPLIILGGIYSGIFTPTESAAVAVLYGLLVSMFVYRQISFRDLGKIIRSSAITNSVVVFVVASAKAFAYVMTVEQLPVKLSNWMASTADNRAVFLALACVVLLFVGCVMDTAPAIMVLGPLFAVMLPTYGIDPLSFGVTMVILLAIGMATPPVGINLYVGASLTDGKMGTVANRHLLVYLLLAVGVVAILMCVPKLITFLPGLIS